MYISLHLQMAGAYFWDRDFNTVSGHVFGSRVIHHAKVILLESIVPLVGHYLPKIHTSLHSIAV